MSKSADADRPIHALIRQRWSPLSFSSRQMTHAQLLSLMEAARWAPSSYNAQPWSFIAALREDEPLFPRLFECLMPGNQRWAGKAGALLLSVASTVDEDGDANRYAYHDAGLASANLILQATSMDLYVHMMGGFNREKARGTFQIPEGREPCAMMAVGYLGEADELPDDLKARETRTRRRKPVSDFLFGKKWNDPPSFLKKEK